MDYHPAEVVRALVLYEGELGAQQRAEALFAGHAPSYIEEWTERLASGLSRALVHMEQATTERYVSQALTRCGARAQDWWAQRKRPV